MGPRRPHNRSGRQRWGIKFQQQVTAVDPTTNLPLTTWVDFGLPCDAEIVEMAGGKRIVNGQPQNEQRYRMTCRWQPGVRQSMRIVWPLDDLIRVFNIESCPDAQGLQHQLDIVAVEIYPKA